MANDMTNCKACGKEIAKGAKTCVHCGKDQRNFFMKHKILTGILAIIILAGIGSALGGNDDKNPSASAVEDTKDNTTNNENTTVTNEDNNENQTEDKAQEVAEPTEAVVEEVEVIDITAEELAKAYEDNEVKADKTYKDVTASITGKVKEIGVILGQTYVVLSSGEEFSITNVQCFFSDENEIDKVAELSDGDTVTIQGVIEGKSLNVTVNDCVFK